MNKKKERGKPVNSNQIKIVIGGLLHDMGKVLFRYNDGRNHSTSGYEFLLENGISDPEILDQVRFHHSAMLKNARIEDDSPAYITYWADNVASGADRRSADYDETKTGYDKYVPLQSVFNILNGNSQNFSYEITDIYDDGRISYPTDGAKNYSEENYSRIVRNIREGVKQIEMTEPYINSLIGVLEANLSFVPSSTDVSQLVDISLFDHVKITAAIGNCIYNYLTENKISNFKEALYKNAREYYEEKTFLMVSMDISGIQNFLYSVDSSGALKSLRSKSFYLEIMLEHIIDELLEKTELTRANLIYSGGGHAYILMPDTDRTRKIIENFNAELKDWFIENFGTELYVAVAYTSCSANELMNKEENSYEDIFRRVSQNLSDKKASRYTPAEIIKLNSMDEGGHTRECRVCRRADSIGDEDLCEFCSSFKSISKGILDEDFITVLSDKPEDVSNIRLPFDRYMILEGEAALRNRLSEDETYIRSYSKNKMYTGFNVSTRLWVGDYVNGNNFEELAAASTGIKRLGVMRADVDNLGQAFVSGFDNKYAGLSRSASFSRKLNMFFKLHINNILQNGAFSLKGVGNERNAVIVYSGGDDVFLIGSWDDVIGAAVDISESLKKYTQGTLSVSAGIGLFPGKYPVKSMARQTGELEEAAKNLPGKNAVSLFTSDGEHSYKWEVFTGNVISEKYALLDRYFSLIPEKGMSVIYNLMNYIRESEDIINLARLAYLLGRMSPNDKASESVKETYSEFSKKIYEWTKKKGEDRRELITAIYIYVYLHRGETEVKNGKDN